MYMWGLSRGRFCFKSSVYLWNLAKSHDNFINGQFHSALWFLLWTLAENLKKNNNKGLLRGESWASVHILFRNVKDNSFCSKLEKRNIFQNIRQKYDYGR